MEHKFTKGEWRVSHGLNVECDGRGIASCGINSTDELIVNQSAWNSKLIAAAPEMLELLETIENDDNQIPEWLWKRIKRVIKKATE